MADFSSVCMCLSVCMWVHECVAAQAVVDTTNSIRSVKPEHRGAKRKAEETESLTPVETRSLGPLIS